MLEDTLEKIVILGGGTAGWMAAAALSRFIHNGKTKIVLVESEAIGTVGVGEATIPPLRNYLQLLRVDENDFIKNTQATFKLGIEFVDWGKKGERYLHPFGAFGADVEGISFHQFFLKQRKLAQLRQEPVPSIESYSLPIVAAYQKRFAKPNGNQFPLNQWSYSYHFDATLVARYLRNYAERLGVKRIEGKVTNVTQNTENGFVRSIHLENGQSLDGDLFIDCSGFRSLLLGQTLDVKHQDWSQWLPCNSAVAIATENLNDPEPYSRSTARQAGWQWHIPLQHRTGNGYVFNKDSISKDQAAETLLSNLNGPSIGEAKFLSFSSGHRKQFWKKNVVALGLAAGFLEPLESTAIHLVQTGIAKLLALFPDKHCDTVQVTEYNRIMTQSYEEIRDFLILHYKQTERNDSDFWNYCRTMSIPDSLQRKFDLFAHRGHIFRYEDELFSRTNWLAVFLGQGLYPKHYAELVNSMPETELHNMLKDMQMNIEKTAQNIPMQQAYIQKYCAAEKIL